VRGLFSKTFDSQANDRKPVTDGLSPTSLDLSSLIDQLYAGGAGPWDGRPQPPHHPITPIGVFA
jgi:hypothetical protein